MEKLSQNLNTTLGNLKKIGKWIGIFIAIVFWYFSIPLIAIWYLYKKDKKLSPRNKMIASGAVIALFVLIFTGMRSNNASPVVTIVDPITNTSIQNSKISVAGTVTPKDSLVSINGRSVAIDKKGEFKTDVELSKEKSTIIVEATRGTKKDTKTVLITRLFTPEELAELKKKEKESELARIESVKTELRKEIESINKPLDTSNFRQSVVALQIELALFGAFAQKMSSYSGFDDAGVKSLLNQYEQGVSRLQIGEFPKMRKSYAENIGKTLWENNITVSVGGTGNKTLTLTGAMFANNKNISTINSTIEESAKMFRFTRINYKWYKYDDTYTYFDIESVPDSKVMVIK